MTDYRMLCQTRLGLLFGASSFRARHAEQNKCNPDIETALPKKKRADQFHVRIRTWLWELLALIICIASLLAIIVTVSIRHGRPPPIFPLGITINAAVAIHSTIMKTTMLYCAAEAVSQSKWIWFGREARNLSDVDLYDQASRGPWGALIMLWRVRWRDLSAFGAIIITLSLAIDAFAQQVIRQETERMKVADGRAVAQVQWFYRHTNDSLISDESAVYSTLLWGSSVGALDTAYICNTGNCSWTPYSSLAVCSTCADVTSHVQITESCFEELSDECIISTPSGSSIAVQLSRHDRYYELGIREKWWTDTTIMNTTGDGSLLNITDVGLSILNFTRLVLSDSDLVTLHQFLDGQDCTFNKYEHNRYDNRYEDNQGPPVKDRQGCLEKLRSLVRADECALHWCAHEYSAMADSGGLTETFLNASWTYPVSGPPDRPFIVSPTYKLMPHHTHGYPSEDTLTVGALNPPPYFVELEAHKTLSRSLSLIFDASISYSDFLSASRNSLGSSTQSSQVASRLALESFATSVGAYEVVLDDRISEKFSDIAHSLTQSIRQYVFAFDGAQVNLLAVGNSKEAIGSQANASAIGTAFENVTVVRVRWGWLVYPINLLLMTIVLTVSTKVRCYQQKIPAWKSSAMPLMVHGPYSHFKESSVEGDTIDQMERFAKRTKVSLQTTLEGWKLCAETSPKEAKGMSHEPGAAACLKDHPTEQTQVQQVSGDMRMWKVISSPSGKREYARPLTTIRTIRSSSF